MVFIQKHFKYKKVVLIFLKNRDLLITTSVDVEGGTAGTPHLPILICKEKKYCMYSTKMIFSYICYKPFLYKSHGDAYQYSDI